MQVKNYSVNGINLCPRIRCVPFKMTNLQDKVHKVKLSGRHSSVVSSVLTILQPRVRIQAHHLRFSIFGLIVQFIATLLDEKDGYEQ